jgi:hypothetical protein
MGARRRKVVNFIPGRFIQRNRASGMLPTASTVMGVAQHDASLENVGQFQFGLRRLLNWGRKMRKVT